MHICCGSVNDLVPLLRGIVPEVRLRGGQGERKSCRSVFFEQVHCSQSNFSFLQTQVAAYFSNSP